MIVLLILLIGLAAIAFSYTLGTWIRMEMRTRRSIRLLSYQLQGLDDELRRVNKHLQRMENFTPEKHKR